jgi:pilus assembly protein FimV
MNTMKRISAATMLAVASLSYSPESAALGLGDATVESFLNQPLAVRIDLISRESDDLASVTARLASADDYELIGASRESVSVPIRFAVEDLDGDPYLMATSALPVGDPVVRLIVEVNWSSGRLLREYTLFLDPPLVPEAAPLPRVDKRAEPAPVSQRPSPEPRTSPETEPAAEADRPAAAPTAGRQPVAAGEYGPVKSGETLWGIARDWSRGTGMEINKVMIAIQRENPGAFLDNNINLLKRGAILRMPAADEVNEIPTAAAINEVSAQSQAFQRGRTADLAASPSTPLLAEESTPAPVEDGEPETEAAAELAPEPEVSDAKMADSEPAEAQEDPAETAPEEEPVPEQEPDQVVTDQLELVPPSAESELDSVYGFEESDEEAADASMAVTSLRENLARTEEELISQQQQNSYLEERIKELEAELAAKQQQGVADADLANLEDRLREDRVTQTRDDTAEPWYSRTAFWLIGLLVVLAGFVGWLLSRRGGHEADTGLGASDELREIQDEAEEVLRVLDEPTEVPAAMTPEEPEGETPEELEEPEDEQDVEQPQAKDTRPKSGRGSEDYAEVLDQESSDPEIQLDLARAYISMGDKEAARVILEEVVANGSEKQQDEAKKMLELLAS